MRFRCADLQEATKISKEHTTYIFLVYVNPENTSGTFLRNTGNNLQDRTVSEHRTLESTD
jgi:hypothetical protein